MGFMARVFTFSIILSALVITGGFCDIPCLNNIGKDKTYFIKPLQAIVGNNLPISQDFIDSHKTNLYELIGKNILRECMLPPYLDFNKIADAESIIIPFEIDNQKYELMVNTTSLFTKFNIPTAILVADKDHRALTPGNEIKKSDMPRDYFFTKECSDHYVRFNLSNSSAVNKAGQSAIGSDVEYFLDFPVGKSCRAFPGLVLGAQRGWGGKEKIIAYNNYKDARKAMNTFADTLRNSACSGLAVYHVALEEMPKERAGTEGWLMLGGVVYGTIYGFSPRDLADIQKVTVMSEPRLIQ